MFPSVRETTIRTMFTTLTAAYAPILATLFPRAAIAGVVRLGK